MKKLIKFNNNLILLNHTYKEEFLEEDIIRILNIYYTN